MSKWLGNPNFTTLVRPETMRPVSTHRTAKVIAGAILAIALVGLGFSREAAAAPCASGVKCFGTCCAPSQVCVNKGAGASCQCPIGTFLCDGTCVESSDDNCGFCGNTCPENTVCFGGTCQCAAGFVFCGGACVSTACDAGEQFNFATCACEPVQDCTGEGGLCTSKNECCSETAKCVPIGGGRKTCQG
jgi:hypothetical protein